MNERANDSVNQWYHWKGQTKNNKSKRIKFIFKLINVCVDTSKMMKEGLEDEQVQEQDEEYKNKMKSTRWWRVQDDEEDEEDEELKDNRKFKNTFDKTIYRLILSSYHIMMLEMLQKDADPWPLKNLFIIGKGEDKRIIIIIIFKLL